MLSRLHLQDFTVFADAEFQFGPGLNVLVGTNGTGKSHVLKVGYAVLNALVDDALRSSGSLIRQVNVFFMDTRLIRVFRPVSGRVSELVRHTATRAEVNYNLSNQADLSGWLLLDAHTTERSSPFSNLPVLSFAQKYAYPVFIPAKEVFTLSWMLPASEQLKLPIDETYLDLLRQLRGLPLQQPEPAAAAAIKVLSDILGGEVEEEGGRYYLTSTTQTGRMEMNMVAEGLRKFGMLQKLLGNGSLTPRATLFWDEPESNLNPALLRQLAEVLAGLARAGFQIILATHSLFLLKQFHTLSRQKADTPLPIRYFGLNAQPGEPTQVTAVDDFEQLPDIVALDEELEQADNLIRVFAQDDDNAHADGR